MKTDTAKTEILLSIRRNLAASAPFDAIYQEHQAYCEAEIFPASTVEEEKNLAELFRKNLEAVGGVCEIVKDRAQSADLLIKIIEKKGAKKIAISDSPLVAEIKNRFETKAEILQNADKESLFECDLGITGAQFGAAETGTLVIESDKEFNRLTSLVPPVHICILETSKIRQTLGEILRELEKDLSRSITFITGQSRTSDIELTLALGIHGPGELFVILIDEK